MVVKRASCRCRFIVGLNRDNVILSVAITFFWVLPLFAGEIPYPVFYAPYDTDTKAVIAGGQPDALGGGATIVPEGKYGGAASFPAMTSIPYRTAGNLRPDRGTIAFWVKGLDWANDDATHTFINAGSGAPYYTFGQLIALQKAGIEGPISAYVGASGSTEKCRWTNGTWHHVAVTYSKGSGKIYVDGEESSTLPRWSPLSDLGASFWVGASPFIGNWAKSSTTLIDDLRIYDHPLDSAEIGAVMRGCTAKLRRTADMQWEVTVKLDPVLRGTSGGRAFVSVFSSETAIPLALQPAVIQDGKAIINIPTASIPVGPTKVRVEIKDCQTRFDPLVLTTTKPAEPMVRLTNDLVELGFDALDGSLLAMRNRATGVDYRRPLAASPLLSLVTTPWATASSTYQPEEVTTLKSDDRSCRGVRLIRQGDRQVVEIVHEFTPYLRVTCNVSLPDKSCLSEWRIKVENKAPNRPSAAPIVQRVNFPMFDGLVIGKDETGNFLALPRVMGQLIPNPSSGGGYMFADEPEKYYPGNASMSWMDLYGEGSGLYLGSHDAKLPATALMSKGHPESKSVSMGIGKWNVLWPGETYEPGPVIVGIHAGDWHWGADRYREYWRAHFDGLRKTPRWLQQADAWTGFGGASYKFKELPHLLEGAKELGMDYLQLWSEMIFGDENYHMVQWPNPFMGTPEELKKGIAQVHKMGGHVGFYYFFTATDPAVNFRFEKEKYRGKVPDWYIKRWFGPSSGYMDAGLMGPDGTFKYTAPIVPFEDGYWMLCPNSKWQQDYVEDFVKRWADYGVDAWYFDTLTLGYSGVPVCYNTRHGHPRPVNNAAGILEIYKKVQKVMDHGDGVALSNECISDICAIYGTHALGNELAAWGQPPKPEIFRYTLPDFLVFSGNCNAIYLSIFPGYENLDPNMYAVSNMIHAYNRVFLLGDRLDLLNTFSWRKADGDEHLRYVKAILALRRKTKEHQYHSDFKDDLGLTLSPQEMKLEAKIFRHREKKSFTITLLDRRKEKAEVTLTIDLSLYGLPKVGKVTLYTIDGKETAITPQLSEGKMRLVIPPRTGDVASILILTP